MTEDAESKALPPTPAVKSDFERAFWSWLKWLFIAYGAITASTMLFSFVISFSQPPFLFLPLHNGLTAAFICAVFAGVVFTVVALLVALLFRRRSKYALGVSMAVIVSSAVVFAIAACFFIDGATPAC